MTVEKLHIEVPIPKDWTGKQAKIVWEFLESIMKSVFEVHGDEIDEAAELEQQRFLAAAREQSLELKPEDDYPF